MSKLIVDSLQKGSSGDVLTLPATDASVNNQPMVSSTTGELSFSPLALPAADGVANKPVTTDGSNQLQFGGFALPAGAGTDGQVLTSTGTAAAWEAVSAPPVADDNDLIIGALFSHSNRQNVYSTGAWSTGGPNSTYYHELNDANSRIAAWNMLLGDGYPDQTNNATSSYMTHAGSWIPSRYKSYAHNRRLGYNFRYFYWHPNGTSYPGCTWMCIPIRNNSASPINVVFDSTMSSQQTYAGSGHMYYTPTFSAGTNYANCTGGAWTVLNSYNSSNETRDYQATIPVPANTTVLYMVTSTWKYRTTYQFSDCCILRNLHTSFTDAAIVCDLRMLEALYMGRQPAATNSAATPYELYTTCATLFGDR